MNGDSESEQNFFDSDFNYDSKIRGSFPYFRYDTEGRVQFSFGVTVAQPPLYWKVMSRKSVIVLAAEEAPSLVSNLRKQAGRLNQRSRRLHSLGSLGIPIFSTTHNRDLRRRYPTPMAQGRPFRNGTNCCLWSPSGTSCFSGWSTDRVAPGSDALRCYILHQITTGLEGSLFSFLLSRLHVPVWASLTTHQLSSRGPSRKTNAVDDDEEERRLSAVFISSTAPAGSFWRISAQGFLPAPTSGTRFNRTRKEADNENVEEGVLFFDDDRMTNSGLTTSSLHLQRCLGGGGGSVFAERATGRDAGESGEILPKEEENFFAESSRNGITSVFSIQCCVVLSIGNRLSLLYRTMLKAGLLLRYLTAWPHHNSAAVPFFAVCRPCFVPNTYFLRGEFIGDKSKIEEDVDVPESSRISTPAPEAAKGRDSEGEAESEEEEAPPTPAPESPVPETLDLSCPRLPDPPVEERNSLCDRDPSFSEEEDEQPLDLTQTSSAFKRKDLDDGRKGSRKSRNGLPPAKIIRIGKHEPRLWFSNQRGERQLSPSPRSSPAPPSLGGLSLSDRPTSPSRQCRSLVPMEPEVRAAPDFIKRQEFLWGKLRKSKNWPDKWPPPPPFLVPSKNKGIANAGSIPKGRRAADLGSGGCWGSLPNGFGSSDSNDMFNCWNGNLPFSDDDLLGVGGGLGGGLLPGGVTLCTADTSLLQSPFDFSSQASPGPLDFPPVSNIQSLPPLKPPDIAALNATSLSDLSDQNPHHFLLQHMRKAEASSTSPESTSTTTTTRLPPVSTVGLNFAKMEVALSSPPPLKTEALSPPPSEDMLPSPAPQVSSTTAPSPCSSTADTSWLEHTTDLVTKPEFPDFHSAATPPQQVPTGCNLNLSVTTIGAASPTASSTCSIKSPRGGRGHHSAPSSTTPDTKDMRNVPSLSVRVSILQQRLGIPADMPLEFVNGGHGIKNPLVGNGKPEVEKLPPVILESDPNKYSCRLCSKTFSLQRLLNRHMKCHSDIKRFLCTFCGKGFNDTFDLKRHTRTHTGVRPYKCGLCEKSFTQRCSLESHCLKVHGVQHAFNYKERRNKVYVCEECGHTTGEPEGHYLHLKDHHPYSPALLKFYDKRHFKFSNSNFANLLLQVRS
ncbi:unnamed protein product [Cyprideis torosa]|uniref:Uncharacterized protein n=1 Tax=Cyprideis torosa TaxID=163714 RepID=A0A7R8W7Z2_9CRUS|nr:unnamed protein product [Cyprideis torosa]CAG0883215.1 unnamed protein product [Cyprideis torosa]